MSIDGAGSNLLGGLIRRGQRAVEDGRFDVDERSIRSWKGAEVLSLAFFTIVSRNYIPFAATLFASLQSRYGVGAEYFLFIADTEIPAHTLRNVNVILAGDLPIASFDRFTFRYDTLELNTALKPSCFKFIMDRGFDQVIFLDPDIYVFGRLDRVHDALASRGASIVLTPHITAPLADDREPSDHAIMKSGVYNMGFFALRTCPESRRLVDWWERRCEHSCRVDIPNHLFTDQRWMDLAPTFCPHHHILTDTAYNVAYWNLGQRELRREGGSWTVDGRDIVFFHFSGFDPATSARLSRHHNRRSIDENTHVVAMMRFYGGEVLHHGWSDRASSRCGYDFFPSGRLVTKFMRRVWVECEARFTQPLGDPRRDLEAWFDRKDPTYAQSGPPHLTRHVGAFIRARPDLMARFDIDTPDGRRRACRWLEHEGDSTGLDLLSIERNGAASDPLEDDARSGDASSLSVLHGLIGTGRIGSLSTWLGETLSSIKTPSSDAIPLSRETLILLSIRSDLRRSFMDHEELKAVDFWIWSLKHPDTLSRHAFSSPECRAWMDKLTRRPIGEFDFLARRIAVLIAGALDVDVGQIPMGSDASADLLVRLYTYMCRVPALDRYRFEVQNALLDDGFWRAARTIEESPWPYAPAVVYYLCRHPGQMNAPDTRIAGDDTRLASWLDRNLVFNGLPSTLRDGLRTRLHRTNPVLHFPSQARGRPSSTAQRSSRVIVTGYFDSVTGRGEDARLIRDALVAMKVDVLTLDRSSGSLTSQDGDRIEPEAVNGCVNICVLNADTAHLDFVWLDRMNLGQGPRVGVWAWELAAFPAQWRNSFEYYDEIWCATDFSYKSISQGRKDICHLVAMPVTLPEARAPVSRGYFHLPSDKYLFFYAFDFLSFPDRKNPEALIRAFRQAFPVSMEDVALFIKVSRSDRDTARWDALRSISEADRRVLFRDATYSRLEMADLMRTTDCFVSPHRAEGFGRGPAEALLCEKPVITVDYSGTTDFCNAETAYIVPHRLIEVEEGQYLHGEGQRWADIDVEALAEALRTAFLNRSESRRLAAEGKRVVRERYSLETSGRQMSSRIADMTRRSGATAGSSR